MISNNYYPVVYKDFQRIRETGNYVVMYAILDDRIHFEMAIENAVFVTQRFNEDIEREIDEKADNFLNNKIQIFLKMALSGNTFYRYYPTKEVQRELKEIKLYTDIVVKEVKSGIEIDQEKLTLKESDDTLRAVDGEDVIIFAEKVR